MKNKIYKICSVLIILLSALNARSEEVIGISDPFQFGSPTPADVPISPIAILIGAGLIGLYSYWRYMDSKGKETV